MREVDRRSKLTRRNFMAGAATAVPAASIAAQTGLSITSAWAEDGTSLDAPTMKTLCKVARDVFPHDFLGDIYYVTAVKPWDVKAAANPQIRSMLVEGVKRLNQDANDRHKSDYIDVAWEADRVVLLQGIEHTQFFNTLRADLVVSLYNQQELWPKFGYEGSSAELGGYIHRGFNDIDWLPKV